MKKGLSKRSSTQITALTQAYLMQGFILSSLQVRPKIARELSQANDDHNLI